MHKNIKNNVYGLVAVLTMLSQWGCAPVTVSSWPEKADVYVKESGKLIGTTPVSVNLFANTKEVVVRKPGYFSKTVELSPIEASNQKVVLRYRNQVVIKTTPTGAEVFAEGEDASVGKTPYLVDYSNGYRRVELRMPGYVFEKVDIPEDPEGNLDITLHRQPTVTILSKPMNVDVYNAHGERMGKTPIDILALEATDLELRKTGYYSKDISVGPKTASPHMIELKREPNVIIYSKPEGATVVHRGVELGKTPYRYFVTKEIDLDLVYDRHYPGRITIAPDSPRKVSVELKSMPYVLLDSSPSGAKLFRSGGVELVGKTPVEILVDKDSALELHKEGFRVKSFMLSSNSKSEVTVPLLRSEFVDAKTVLIDSFPSGALVYRPGGAELIGQTPLTQKVRSERNFELHKEGFRTKIVTVAPDSANNITFALARDESARNATISDPLLNTPSSF